MNVLHLVGSTQSKFYFNLSYVYYQHVVAPPRTVSKALLRSPDGSWILEEGSSKSREITLSDIPNVVDGTDLVVPHMFCPQGMTAYRAYFEDVIGIPVAGPTSRTTTLALSKWDTKAVAMAAGVRCPRAVRVTDIASHEAFKLPYIVKPDTEDNSIGISLVLNKDDHIAAVSQALSFAPVAIVEEYIAGREFRVGVIEVDGQTRVLPAIEFHVSADRPIRTLNDKLDVSDDGAISATRWNEPTIPTTCPAIVTPALYQEMSDAALAMHNALSSRDYSLYDFRVDSEGRVFLIEACPFWSFSSRSALSFMVTADEELDLAKTIGSVWRNAAKRRHHKNVH